MDSKFLKFYREIFADLTVDREESQQLKTYFLQANPPPDKHVWLRATAFRVGSEFLSEDNMDKNTAVLRCINAIVHTLEMTCMQPKPPKPSASSGSSKNELKEKAENFYREIFSDLTIDREESAELKAFFDTANIPKSELVGFRAAAFRIGSEFFGEDKAANVSLLRSINVVVHFFEQAFLEPKSYVLHVEPKKEKTVARIGLHASIEDAVQHLWDLDVNRLTPGRDYKINVQSGKKAYQKFDAAQDPLFTMVDKSVFRRPTYRCFYHLLDNYHAETGTADTLTRSQQEETHRFLKAIMQTGPMQFCHKYCCANGKDIPRDRAKFQELLYDIWFKPYHRARNCRADSSGFEHVFVGEIKDNKVSGFHNWIQFYLEEKKGALDYRGYIKPRSKRDAATNEDDHVLNLQFKWKGVEKMVGTSFIGVSPEFEMALYTTCFLVGEEENRLELDTGTDLFELVIKCYTMARGKIGTSFPEVQSHSD
mmetsp:Transcript_39209/g.57660  ORF Transcript_39209/g.57660 Transcript_39209/m.57660 type:complete len:481 (-) Transcript_39209:179-1621(-)|eukprot:CAMPEP_0195520684 /NCGR_PEP_ID=MMETSP0794_2-20130614/17421_1 /TAXON_ID=515487 /ORGANISM="Stephanopyxis turris, Strain CCMP 815" /LENGTH=480 /DNA_ID=CAMNT_0040650095 /DNA_START=171 /DNA_END=1613 /DNA_ORIENTATION=+